MNDRKKKYYDGATAIVIIVAILLTVTNQMLYLLFLLIPLVWLSQSKNPAEIGITKKNILRSIILGLFVGIVYGLLKYILTPQQPWLTAGILTVSATYLQKFSFLTYTIMIIVGSSIREFFYRGYLQTRFMKNYPPSVSILLASILLALADPIAGISSMSSAFINGTISGYLFYRTKNLMSSIVFIPTQFIVILLLSL